MDRQDRSRTSPFEATFDVTPDDGTPSVRVSFASGEPGPCIVTIAGELDFSNSTLAGAQIETFVLPGRDTVLDLRELTFIDSSGLGLVVRTDKLVREGGGNMIVVLTRPSLRKLFAITNLDKHLRVVDRIEDAQF